MFSHASMPLAIGPAGARSIAAINSARHQGTRPTLDPLRYGRRSFRSATGRAQQRAPKCAVCWPLLPRIVNSGGPLIAVGLVVSVLFEAGSFAIGMGCGVILIFDSELRTGTAGEAHEAFPFR